MGTGRLAVASSLRARGLRGDKSLDGEIPAGADGRSRRKVRMSLNVVPRNAITRTEVGDQRLGRGDLPGRGRLLVQVADETDPDAVLVNLRILGIAAVHAVLLVDPSLRDLDLAVFTARAVADHKVVTAAIVAQNLAVLMVDLVVVARGVGTVVQDDVLPGSVGLAGIEELVAPRLAEVRVQCLLGTRLAHRAACRRGANAIGRVHGRRS